MNFFPDRSYGSGDAQVAEEGYVNPSWAPVLLVVHNPDWFSVVDDPSRPSPSTRWPGQDFHKYYDTCKSTYSFPTDGAVSN
jgi:hypothetical protein